MIFANDYHEPIKIVIRKGKRKDVCDLVQCDVKKCDLVHCDVNKCDVKKCVLVQCDVK